VASGRSCKQPIIVTITEIVGLNQKLALGRTKSEKTKAKKTVLRRGDRN